MSVTEWGERGCGTLEDDYYKCWEGFQKHFNPK